MKYVIAVLVVVVVGGFLIYRYQTRELSFSQQYVEALAARLLPGARPVTGTKGVVAIDKELIEAAIFAPSLKKVKEPLTGGEVVIAVARIKVPPTDREAIEKWKAFLDERKALKRIESGPTTIQVGNHKQMALRSITQSGENPRMLDYTTLFLFPDRGIVVKVEGPEASFNQAAMDEFMGRLEVPAPPGPPAGAPKPQPPSIPKPHLPEPPQARQPPKVPAPAPPRMQPPQMQPPRMQAPARPKVPRPHRPGPPGGPPPGFPGPP